MWRQSRTSYLKALAALQSAAEFVVSVHFRYVQSILLYVRRWTRTWGAPPPACFTPHSLVDQLDWHHEIGKFRGTRLAYITNDGDSPDQG